MRISTKYSRTRSRLASGKREVNHSITRMARVEASAGRIGVRLCAGRAGAVDDGCSGIAQGGGLSVATAAALRTGLAAGGGVTFCVGTGDAATGCLLTVLRGLRAAAGVARGRVVSVGVALLVVADLPAAVLRGVLPAGEGGRGARRGGDFGGCSLIRQS